MHDAGAGTLIIWFLIVGGILLYEWRKGNVIWDTSAWMIRQKSPAEKAAERLEKYSTDNYNISWGNQQKQNKTQP